MLPRCLFLLPLIAPFLSLNAQKSLQAFRLTEPITVDGVHEPERWQGAQAATAFVQMQPAPGKPASEHTLCYLGFDEENIYLSVILDQESEVLAKVLNRDGMSDSEDGFVLILDTYHDQRTGFGFWTNPLGTQCDFRINDDGRNTDENWDTEWESATQIREGGWSLEMAIPFKSIRYKAGIHTWGLNFTRVLAGNLESANWSGLLSDFFRMSQGGRLEGIEPPRKRGSLTLFPYGTLSYENNDFTGVAHQVKPDAGLDAKWQINSSTTADATLNPDFATVEGDQERINLTRYELNYPEKRLFFQEGNEMYSTRIRTFYSRRIQDILYGAKLTGKAGKTNFNAMNAMELSRDQEEASPNFFTTARVKRDFLGSSTMGFTAVDRRNDSSFVTSFSGDYLLNLGETWKLTGQFVASLPGDFLSHSAWFVRFAKENSIYHFHVRYTEMGEHFQENVNQTGYVVDDDRREVDSDLNYRFWIRNGVFQYIRLSSKNNMFWARTSGALRSWYFTESIDMYFQNRISLGYSYNNEYKLFEKDYHNYRSTFELGYNTAEWSHAAASYSFGRNFDADFQRLSFGGRLKLTEKLAASYEGDLIHFDPGSDRESTMLNVLSLNYNFTKDLWVKVFAQNSTATKRIYVYGLAGWRFRPPFGALYLIYSHDQEAEVMGDPTLMTDALFLKLTLPIHVVR